MYIAMGPGPVPMPSREDLLFSRINSHREFLESSAGHYQPAGTKITTKMMFPDIITPQFACAHARSISPRVQAATAASRNRKYI